MRALTVADVDLNLENHDGTRGCLADACKRKFPKSKLVVFETGRS